MDYSGSQSLQLFFLSSFNNVSAAYFHLGKSEGSKSEMYLGYKKIYDFQHPKKFFDDFNQNLILRILDGRIQIIHDKKGMEYYPSKENNLIKKEKITYLTILSFSKHRSAKNWTIQPVQIQSGSFK